MAQAARAMAMVMRVVGNKEGIGMGGKGNGNCDKVCRSKIVRTLRILRRQKVLHQW
jgi:hypothetical protein